MIVQKTVRATGLVQIAENLGLHINRDHEYDSAMPFVTVNRVNGFWDEAVRIFWQTGETLVYVYDPESFVRKIPASHATDLMIKLANKQRQVTV